MACNQEPLAYYRLHDNNEGKKQKKRQLNEYKVWVDEQSKKPEVKSLPAFAKVLNEVSYMEGLIEVEQNSDTDVNRIFRILPWGKYKLKLFARWKLSWILRFFKL